MTITYYSYDHIDNPRCGGGGAYRGLEIHKRLAPAHTITFVSGNFAQAQDGRKYGIDFHFPGLRRNYLLSRISFALLATWRSLFDRADVLVIEFSVYAPVPTFLFKPRRTIVQFNHIIGNEPIKKYGVFGIAAWIAERIALAGSKNLITIAESTACLIRQKYPEGKDIRVIYTGFNEELLRLKPEDNRYILCLGRLDVHMKGIDILLHAYRQISSKIATPPLVLAGRGTQKDIAWIGNFISAHKLNCRLHINISEEQKFDLLRKASFVCMPSRFEGWNIVAIEAAACSKATIGTNIPGLRDSIRHENTGILVEPESSERLATALKKMITDADYRAGLARNGRQWARTFTWDAIAAEQERFYLDLSNKRSSH
ncbi:MAG: glycosyltransferase [Chitinivibrionales bacterium]|nr:glycosyltransferase [Chitinivibrionales bacterium]